MDPEIQWKQIEETVRDILKQANMEEVTEFTVRVTAAERLGIDLSGIEHKRFIRGVVESYLVSSVEAEAEAEAAGGAANGSVGEETKEVVREEEERMPRAEVDGYGNRIICKLSNKRNVVVQEFKGKSFVQIREFFHNKDGKQVPSNKGICLTDEQWLVLKDSIPAIEEAITKMQSKLSSELNGKQDEQVSDSVTASAADSVTASAAPRELVPVEISRFDGKNYQHWAKEMEFFLKQLDIAYVLSDPCPNGCVSSYAKAEEIAQAKAAEQKWLNDDYLCRHNILNSLSDSLYYQYMKKTKGAKELWEELKVVYLNEETETKRSQVKKYIEYQMVDEKSVLDQLQELNSIADAIVASGMFLDENFHVSAVISKLPPSWKDFCIRLMREEYLPYWSLMENVRLEEESRKPEKQGEPLPYHPMYSHHARNFGPGMREMKKPGFQWKRQESEWRNKPIICNFCGKRGHISKHCHNKRFNRENNGRLDENSSTPVASDVNNGDGRVGY